MTVVPKGVFSPPAPIDFEWDEQRTLQYFYFLPAPLHGRLLGLTHNACFALTIGVATWIWHRFEQFGKTDEVRDYVDAAWAEMAEGWYCETVTRSRDDWRGPWRNPLASLMSILNDAIDGRDSNPVQADRTVWMINLARHVIRPAEPFERWLEAVISRLELLHGWGTEAPVQDDIFADSFWQGDVVSPDALDPGSAYSPASAEAALMHYLQEIERRGNPHVVRL